MQKKLECTYIHFPFSRKITLFNLFVNNSEYVLHIHFSIRLLIILTCSFTAVFAATEEADVLELGPSELAACSLGELKERRHLTRFRDMITQILERVFQCSK